MLSRTTARSMDEATARIWDKYPKAIGIFIKYLYCGWYEYSIVEEV